MQILSASFGEMERIFHLSINAAGGCAKMLSMICPGPKNISLVIFLWTIIVGKLDLVLINVGVKLYSDRVLGT